MFGYITVLPGAFSAYRYIALQNDARGEGPLQKYFLGETMVRRPVVYHFYAPNHFRSTGRARTSSPQTCTLLRTVYVTKDMGWKRFFLTISAIRSCAGNWCRSAAGRGYFTTSSRRTVLPILRIRFGCVAHFGYFG